MDPSKGGLEMNRGVYLLVSFISAACVIAQEPVANIDSPIKARSVTVLRAAFPSRGAVHSVSFDVAKDGEEFEDARIGPDRGAPFSGATVCGSDLTDTTVLALPACGRFDLTPKGFLFPTEGVYHLQWKVAFKDPKASVQNTVQTIHVEAPSPYDIGFLAQISDNSFFEESFGRRVPDSFGPNKTALALIGMLLSHAISDPTEDEPIFGGIVAADALLKLASEHPESSFAPYAAYYAGSIYWLRLLRSDSFRKSAGTSGMTEKAVNEPMYHKANEAWSLAREHADSFLAPRVLCRLALLRTCASATNTARELLRIARQTTPNDSAMLYHVDVLEREIAKLIE